MFSHGMLSRRHGAAVPRRDVGPSRYLVCPSAKQLRNNGFCGCPLTIFHHAVFSSAMIYRPETRQVISINFRGPVKVRRRPRAIPFHHIASRFLIRFVQPIAIIPGRNGPTGFQQEGARSVRKFLARATPHLFVTRPGKQVL